MTVKLRTIFCLASTAALLACGGGGGGGDGSDGAGGGNGGGGADIGDTSNLTLGLSQVSTGLASPVHLTAPAGDARLFVVERRGAIQILAQDGSRVGTFLDIDIKVAPLDGERGLMSLAFDPAYAENGRFYVFYAADNGDAVVERYTVSAADPDLADAASGTILLTVPHGGSALHYGGMLHFGPDGMLYASTGDAQNGANAQDLGSRLGKVLRIDVSGGAEPTIWGYGLRNPWRFSFDGATGRMYLSDVGESSREEVNVVAPGEAGLNFGWNVMEGSQCFGGTECDQSGKRLPTLEYAHGDGGACSIIGGYVYRGSAIPELRGHYLYSDFCGGWLRSFAFVDGTAQRQKDWQEVPSQVRIQSFGQDGSGELYLLTGAGEINRLVRQP